uniref:Uncharacterized protein n=1 Tax=Anguilla anguilla TaxID=7936 RepID=A0A0E9PHY0_ANGAN
MSQLPLSEKFIVDQAACANFSYRRKLITTLRSVFHFCTEITATRLAALIYYDLESTLPK